MDQVKCDHLWSGSGPDGTKHCIKCRAVVDHMYQFLRWGNKNG